MTLVTVRVKPGAHQPQIGVEGGMLVVRVRERAIEGAANEAVVRALAAHFAVPESKVKLIRGAASRLKRFSIG